MKKQSFLQFPLASNSACQPVNPVASGNHSYSPAPWLLLHVKTVMGCGFRVKSHFSTVLQCCTTDALIQRVLTNLLNPAPATEPYTLCGLSSDLLLILDSKVLEVVKDLAGSHYEALRGPRGSARFRSLSKIGIVIPSQCCTSFGVCIVFPIQSCVSAFP